MSYEFKLVAGLTLKQFIFIAVGGAICFGLAMGTSNKIIRPELGYPLLVIVFIVTVSFALVRIQNRSMDAWFQDYTNAFKSPTRRLWKKDWKAMKVDPNANPKPDVFPDYLKIYFQEPEDLEEELKLIEEKNKQIGAPTTAPGAAPAGAVAKPEVTMPGLMTEKQVAAANHQMATSNTQAQLQIISSANASQFAMDPNRYLKMPNVLAFIAVDNKNQPLANVVGLLKQASGEVIAGLRSNTNGVIYFDKQLPNGSYLVSFELAGVRFPTIQTVLEGTSPLPVIKVPGVVV